MTKAEKIAALIANEQMPFTKDDSAKLEACSEAELDALASQTRDGRIEALISSTKTPAAPVAAAAAATSKVAQTVDEFINSAPTGMQDALRSGVKAAEAKRTASIKALKDTGRCQYSDAELGAMSQTQLDTLVTLSGAAVATVSGVDFGGQGAPRVAQNGDAAPAAPSVRAALAAKK